ncbi:MAG: nucleoside hydrolase [Phycisphaeraceae bacterium]
MLSESFRVDRLAVPDVIAGPVDVVLDTDTFNEIDDQFAIVYAYLSPDRINLEAIYAAPFKNDRSSSPGEGMELSYDEIQRVLERLGDAEGCPVRRGSDRWMDSDEDVVESEAVQDLIERAENRRRDDSPLYVVAIGAPTNVASALVKRPEIREKVVVVWLGGHPHHWPTQAEFNLAQDDVASRTLFDSGVPFVRVPCRTVAQALRTTPAEMRDALSDGSPVEAFLLERFLAYEGYEVPRRVGWNGGRPIAYGKEIWDLGPIAWLVDPSWTQSHLRSSAILQRDLTLSQDLRRHQVRELTEIDRDAVFGDLFTKMRHLRGLG